MPCSIDALFVGTKTPPTAKEVQRIYRRMRPYENKILVNKLRDELKLTRGDALALFADVKKFLALSAVYRQRLWPPPAIDEGWHVFLAFTKDYPAFCKKYCGGMIHHVPEDPLAPWSARNRERMLRTVERAQNCFRTSLSMNWTVPKMPDKT